MEEGECANGNDPNDDEIPNAAPVIHLTSLVGRIVRNGKLGLV
jgi:hypothetical protein